MERKTKGEYGYISYRKKVTTIRTCACLFVAVSLFVAGLIIYGSQKNVFSIVAALSCLPTGWSGVNMIMFLRAKGCPADIHSKIEDCKGGLLIRYDQVVTSYDKNFDVFASTVLDKNVCLLMDSLKFDPTDLEKHVKKMMAQGGYSNLTIKVFDNVDQYLDRIKQLEKLRNEKSIDPKKIEDSWIPGTNQTPASILLSISL